MEREGGAPVLLAGDLKTEAIVWHPVPASRGASKTQTRMRFKASGTNHRLSRGSTCSAGWTCSMQPLPLLETEAEGWHPMPASRGASKTQTRMRLGLQEPSHRWSGRGEHLSCWLEISRQRGIVRHSVPASGGAGETQTCMRFKASGIIS